jgi:hypothetical protein
MKAMVDLRGIPTNPGLKTSYVPPEGFQDSKSDVEIEVEFRISNGDVTLYF